MKKITISDVAKLAGVSSGTVSRVMNGASNVTPEIRYKVEQAISQLGYQPNLQARSLRNRRTDTIALAIPELTNYFWTTVARGVQESAQANGYHVLICNTLTKSRQNLRYLTSIINRVDGMILSRRSEWEAINSEAGSNQPPVKPIVMVSQSQAARWNVSNVYSDSISGAYRLTQHLIGLGRRQIAVITGRQSSASANDRVAGYGMALLDAGLPLDDALILWGEYDRRTAERLTHELIAVRPDTSAIVAANNEIAIGVMNGLEKHHRRVPDDIALVCFDDFYPDSRFASFMTVASQSPYDIGVNATELLLKRLNSDDYVPIQSVILPTRLIVRQSCGGTPTPNEVSDTLFEDVQGELILPLTTEQIRAALPQLGAVLSQPVDLIDQDLMPADKTNVTYLKQVLFGKGDRGGNLLHFEYALNDPRLYRMILEREPHYDDEQGEIISADDQIEFAARCGLDAVACRLLYRTGLNNLERGAIFDMNDLVFELPSFPDQLAWFDRFARAAKRNRIGIVADCRCMAANTLALLATFQTNGLGEREARLRQLADGLFEYHRKVVQLICDRFSNDLAFVILSDVWADENGLSLPSDALEHIFYPHIRRIVQAVHTYGLPVVLHTPGKMDGLIGWVRQLGFDGLYLAQPEVNDLVTLQRAAGGELSLLGGLSSELLKYHPESSVEVRLHQAVTLLDANHRYVLGLGGDSLGEVDRQSFFAYLRCAFAMKEGNRLFLQR